MACSICIRNDRAEIDDALGVKSVRAVSQQFNIPHSSLGRHRKDCIRRPDLLTAEDLRKASRRTKLLRKLEGLLEQVMGATRRARRSSNDEALLKAIKHALDVIRAMGEIGAVKDEPQPQPQVHFEITLAPGGPLIHEVSTAVPLGLPAKGDSSSE